MASYVVRPLRVLFPADLFIQPGDQPPILKEDVTPKMLVLYRKIGIFAHEAPVRQTVNRLEKIDPAWIGDGDGRPMIATFLSCVDSIRTIPFLQHDPDRPEDVMTDSEDHAADEWRYACVSRPWVPAVEVPEPKNVSGYRVVRADVRPGDWKAY